MSLSLTVAAVQCAPIFDDVSRASAHILSCAAEAAAARAHLIIFPESYLQGHSYKSAVVQKRAFPVDDPAILDLAKRLAEFPLVAVIGFFERRGDNIYNSAVVLGEGRILGCYAKHDPREGGCAAGTDRPVFSCNGWTFAISICRDTRSSDLALDLAARGAELLCYPLNNMLPPEAADRNWQLTTEGHQMRARETGCWVISADVVGAHDGWKAYGNTRVIDPQGEIVAEVPESQTGLIVVTIG